VADIDYVKIQDGDSETGEIFILAAERLDHYYKSEEDYSDPRALQRERPGGDQLRASAYRTSPTPLKEGAFKTFLGDFVTTEDGTGIVHLAPGFGEDDYNTLKGSGIPTVCPIDDECKFTEEIPEYQGQFVKDADKAIIARLKEEGKLVRRENYLHPYPHCYRTGAPLIYKAVTSWFVDIGKIKGRMLGGQRSESTGPLITSKNGRFGKWLEGARDWAISRNRFWGNPIPVWQCDKTGEMVCVGSIDELEKLSGVRPDDLHKHFRGRDHLAQPRGGNLPAGSGGPGLLVRIRGHALRPGPLSLREQRVVREELPGQLHLRGSGPDPGLVLHPDHPGGSPVRQAGLPERGGQRPGAGGRRQEDVQEPAELLRPHGSDQRVRGRCPAAVYDDELGGQGRRPQVLRHRGPGRPQGHPDSPVELLLLLHHLR
jgi:hypothetical protein